MVIIGQVQQSRSMHRFRVPALPLGELEATVSHWFKRAGDAVAVDELLVELDTDREFIEVPAPAAGTLVGIAAKAGATGPGRAEKVAANSWFPTAVQSARSPITGIAGCCARTASGHANADPAIPATRAHRRIAFPRIGTASNFCVQLRPSKQESPTDEMGSTSAMCTAKIPSHFRPSWVKSPHKPQRGMRPLPPDWSKSGRKFNSRMHRGLPPLRAKKRPEQVQQKFRRGRDASCLAPPAQTRTCSFPAYGSHLGY
jgi:Biotin-requiring enzyme